MCGHDLRQTRRGLIIAIAVSATPVLSGCGLMDKDTGESRGKTPEDGQALPAGDCGSYTAVDPKWTVSSNRYFDGFKIEIANREISIGDTVTVSITNTSGEERTTGVKQKYDIQRKSGEAWRSIFGVVRERPIYSDKGITHQPGEGFQWEFEFSSEGLSEEDSSEPTYKVCNSLRNGEYRFVYWGVPSKRGETNEAIAVRFSVSQ
jgi:hypothetical protein